jgi:hypothetical protein
VATRMSTTRYSRIKVTTSILPEAYDAVRTGLPARYLGRTVAIGGRSASDTVDVRGV